jgi:hypothetical protein
LIVPDEGYDVPNEGYYVPDEGYYVPDEGYYVPDEAYYLPDEGYQSLTHSKPSKGINEETNKTIRKTYHTS